MKLSSIISLTLAGFAAASPTLSNRGEEHSLSKRREFPSVDGLKFKIDGRTSYFQGTNSYWIGYLTNNADVDLVFSHLRKSNLKVLRVWGFNDITTASSEVWYQSFIPGQAPQINTGPLGLQRLDYVVKSATAHGIKLIINFVNNWGDYGGMAAYNSYYNTTAATWYTDARVQTQYRRYIKTLVQRYKDSNAVFAWELANEPRCKGCATSVVTDWATTTSKYIKSLDSKHMVTLGDEGWLNGGGDGTYPYTTTEGVDFEANLKIPTLDFGTFHLYPISWSVDFPGWGSAWIANHGAVCAKVGKPCILEEYGHPDNKTEIQGPWQKTALASKGIAGDMFWQYGDTLSTGKTSDDGNTIYYGSDIFEQLVIQHGIDIAKSEGWH